jgi:hypothetical protein
MLAAIGSVAPAAAEKPTLVRDVDRPSVTPISVECVKVPNVISQSCQIFTVPEGMVLVVDTISVFASGEDSSVDGGFPFISAANQASNTAPKPFTMVFSPVPVFKSLPGFIGGHVSTQMQFTAGAELTVGILVGTVSGPTNLTASLFGHLVAAGSP